MAFSPKARSWSRLRGFLLLSTLLTLPSGLAGQEEVVPILEGQVKAGPDPLPGAMVVLHQVSDEVSGEIDSIQAGPDGEFQLSLPRMPDHGVSSEIFFASVRHQGLLYFGAAITTPLQLDSLYLIQAYDTISVPTGGVRLPISARNLFLTKREEGWDATDFFQLRQEGEGTLYSPEEGTIWQYPLPEGIQDFEVGQADLSPDAVRFEGGNLTVYSPIPPGERFFLVRYQIPTEDFSVPMPGLTEHMEVLVRDPGPRAEFPPLLPSTPVELEPGNIFNRFEGDNLRDSELRARVLPNPFEFRAEWMGLILAAILGGVGVFAYRVRGPRRKEESPKDFPADSRSDLVRTIAELDEAFQRRENPEADVQAEYQARRKRLLDRLKSVS